MSEVLSLEDKIHQRKSGIILYGLTPPKINTEVDRIQLIADKQIARLQNTNVDGLILYDIQDESSRTEEPRPFPFLPTLTPDTYSNQYLQDLLIPKIIYKSVGKCNQEEFKQWLHADSEELKFSVFVGSPSKTQKNNLSLNDAYTINKTSASPVILGGVTIPERHDKKGDEHLRVIHKVEKGCQYFISQCVYNLNNSKNFLSDYYYSSQEKEMPLVPIIFTLTPCGSSKTLNFMEWLGIDIPKWLRNDLMHSQDILRSSVEICKMVAEELLEFSNSKEIPIGFNIESVAIRKEEIDASIELLRDVKNLM